MWLAAEYGGEYTYARLLSRQILTGNSKPATQFSTVKPLRRRELLTELAIRVIGEMR
jgi:hypothetical protein